ncbi:predicted protein [Naegleria gruberi]|uniref:Predicted protein n=1 Tax=Naegleria gruberi TaxID=5762 RepID=D2VB96_NAEGR|nr:uncharacterized protein NAEGRDRAFT_66138 [Naegleria gruberi]EFC45758.1 predicted protein [Naegleria gruberi]|eukprot:XP_002678502.1 predicted protein [Naegleria gruberi strain NEG-M]
MSKQLIHGNYPVNGMQMSFNKNYSLICAFFIQFIPLFVLHFLFKHQYHLALQVIVIPIVYLVCGGRWTLNYHNLLHQLSGLNPILDIFLGVGFGHLLSFGPGKKGHDSHHRINYGENDKRISLENIEDLSESDIEYRLNEILAKDADFWCKSSLNRWTLFLRSSQFEMNYIQFYLKNVENAKQKLFPIYMTRLALLLLPYLFLNPILYSIHLVLCRLVMALIFMVFTTLSHEKGWFDGFVAKFYPFQKWLDVNVFLELLIGYHVHHVNEHDNHHTYPKRDVSILANMFE